MGLRLWPSDFEKLSFLSKGEKYLLRTANRNFTNGHFVLPINPMHMFSGIKMGMYISPTEGLLTFTVFDGEMNLYPLNRQLISYFEGAILKRLLDAKVLIARNNEKKILRFPYKHVFVYPEQQKLPASVPEEKLLELKDYVTFCFFRPLDSDGKETQLSQFHIFGGIRVEYDSNFTMLDEIQIKAIFERLAPEYSIVMPEIEHTEIIETTQVISDADMYVTGKEVEYRTFCLDPFQVSIVNSMGRGHRVILANPGSGKSVLLLARSFKYSSVYPDSKVLLTCYNNNLADSYQFKKSCASFVNEKNLYIFTFHKLVIELLREGGIEITNGYPSEQDIQTCLHLIIAGRIVTRFKAVFIDEIQIFEPLYIEICYRLLEQGNESAFILTGDLNQTVRRLSRRGDAPWKRMPEISLDFTGRVKYIEKNYRNSREISSYLKSMLILMNNRFDMLHLINKRDYEYDLFEVGQNETLALHVETGISRFDITEKVIAAVQEIYRKYGVSYCDIAILFPYRQHRSLKYTILNWLENRLREEGIYYSKIIQSNEEFGKTKYRETTGVVLSTIDSSLGLDFKAVILCGLYPLGFVSEKGSDSVVKQKKIKSWTSIEKMTDLQKEEVVEHMRKIYTACSRARDVLYVLSDIDKESPVSEIIEKRD